MREEILQAVEQKGSQYEREYWDCAQCTLLAVQEVFGLKADGRESGDGICRGDRTEGLGLRGALRRRDGPGTPFRPRPPHDEAP